MSRRAIERAAEAKRKEGGFYEPPPPPPDKDETIARQAYEIDALKREVHRLAQLLSKAKPRKPTQAEILDALSQAVQQSVERDDDPPKPAGKAARAKH